MNIIDIEIALNIYKQELATHNKPLRYNHTYDDYEANTVYTASDLFNLLTRLYIL